MKTSLLITLAFLPALASYAETTTENAVEANSAKTEFPTEENHEPGFLGTPINQAIERGMRRADHEMEYKYGRTVTDFATAPKVGGYYMSGYYYSSQEGAHNGDGFKQKNVRLYVSGSVFKHFNYLVQVQLANAAFHMKDFWMEWKKYPEFSVKVGQFIRVFGFENPYNPFEYRDGAYALITQKLAAQADYIGTDNGGGRDQGIQVQGDLFPVGKDQHRLVHYQLMLSNGQTINTGDANGKKDISGTFQLQPIKGFYLAFYGWTGDHKANNVTVNRNRYMISAFYDVNEWTARAEYAHSTGHKISDYNAATGEWSGAGEAQGWYATLGIPFNDWLKLWLKYDAYQDDACWGSTRSIYSISPNIQIHKNLWFQPRVGYVHDRTLDTNWTEVSVEMGVRF